MAAFPRVLAPVQRLHARVLPMEPADPFALSVEQLDQELAIAGFLTGDWELAGDAVVEAVDSWPLAVRTRRDNVRNRSDRSDHKGTGPASTLLDRPSTMLRFVVLVEAWGESHPARARLSPSMFLRRFLVIMVLEVLQHNSFWATILVGRVLADIKAKILLAIHRRMTKRGGLESECTKKKGKLLGAAVRQMPQDFATLSPAANPDAFIVDTFKDEPGGVTMTVVRTKATTKQADATFEALRLLMPSDRPQLPPANDREELSRTELIRVRDLITPSSFDIKLRTANDGDCTPGITQSTWLPLFKEDYRDDDPLFGAPPTGDRVAVLKRVMERIQRHRARQRKFPYTRGFLRIVVDGAVKHVFENEEPCRLALPPGSRLVKIVAADEESGPLALAACALTFDTPRTDVWEVPIGEDVILSCELVYNDDETVVASFNFRSSVPAVSPIDVATRGPYRRAQLRSRVFMIATVAAVLVLATAASFWAYEMHQIVANQAQQVRQLSLAIEGRVALAAADAAVSDGIAMRPGEEIQNQAGVLGLGRMYGMNYIRRVAEQRFVNARTSQERHRAMELLDTGAAIDPIARLSRQRVLRAELITMGLQQDLRDAQGYFDGGALQGSRQAVEIYSRVVDRLSHTALEGLDQAILATARSNAKEEKFDDAARRFKALFADYIDDEPPLSTLTVPALTVPR